MPKIKIKPINIDKAKDVKGISKNISDVVDYITATASDLNRVIGELNAILPGETKRYDDSDLVKKIDDLAKSIPAEYDDSEIKLSIKSIKFPEPEVYDDTKLIERIRSFEDEVERVEAELKLLKSSAASNQKEIRSNRKESSYKIDVVEQKINRLTEI